MPNHLQSTLFIRVLFGWINDVFLFLAPLFTSYGKALAINFTNALMIPFVGRLMIKEHFSIWDVTGALIGILGIVLSVLPYKDMDSFRQGKMIDNFGEGINDLNTDLLGVFFAFMSAVTSSVSIV